jgi:hypothetical protein
MQGLQERTRLPIRRAQILHARTPTPREGEGVPRHTTMGNPWSWCAGGESIAFSGDRAQARRKAVDAPKAPYPGIEGAPAPDPKHDRSLAPWQSLAVVCARVIAQLGRSRPLPALAAGERLGRELAAAGLPTPAIPSSLPGELSQATAGRFYPRHRTARSGP